MNKHDHELHFPKKTLKQNKQLVGINSLTTGKIKMFDCSFCYTTDTLWFLGKFCFYILAWCFLLSMLALLTFSIVF